MTKKSGMHAVACADEFLERFPDGLDTMLVQGGNNLSGGQKQRLCIARALLASAKILIFDDSTSAVDTATEKKIRKELEKLGDVTKIIIAQRISSVIHTDRIVILDDGKIHNIGTHEQLLKEDAIYQEIYASPDEKEETAMASKTKNVKRPENMQHTPRIFVSILDGINLCF